MKTLVLIISLFSTLTWAEDSIKESCEKIASVAITTYLHSSNKLSPYSSDAEIVVAESKALASMTQIQELALKTSDNAEYASCKTASLSIYNTLNPNVVVINGIECEKTAARSIEELQIALNNKNSLLAGKIGENALRTIFSGGVLKAKNPYDLRKCARSQEQLFIYLVNMPGGIAEFIRKEMPEYADRLE
ncbi:MAG: hypothetical protein V4596_10840 [Bdellovibrionota bacterium]